MTANDRHDVGITVVGGRFRVCCDRCGLNTPAVGLDDAMATAQLHEQEHCNAVPNR